MNEILNVLKNKYKIDETIYEFVNKKEEDLGELFKNFDRIMEYNQYKVLSVMQENQLSASDFYWTTGYGYGDIGRDKTEAIFAGIFNAEDSLVRTSIASGTHAINLVLSGLLKSGEHFIEISGTPYDTLKDVIGLSSNDNIGSLLERGVEYSEVALKNNEIDLNEVIKAVRPNTKMFAIQRSTGYSDRIALNIDQISKAVRFLKEKFPEIIIFVDNCYGEFTDLCEPTDLGADVIAGSLIKNPGGGIANSGGYICGKKRLIQIISRRLYAPGLEKEVGLSYGMTRNILQGIYIAPMVVNQALKGASLLGNIFQSLGFDIIPKLTDRRSDIILGIKFEKAELVEEFCKAIQEASAVDSHVTPVPAPMPGYQDNIIMASGGFVEGSSIEMSADGPLRNPFYCYYQGGITYPQVKLASMIALRNMINKNLINLK